MKRLTFAIASAIALAVSAPAFAAAPHAPLTAQVHYGDINTDTVAGGQALHARLRTAAREVCDDTRGAGSYADRMVARGCVRETMNRTVADLDIPMLTLAHLDRGGYVPRIQVASR